MSGTGETRDPEATIPRLRLPALPAPRADAPRVETALAHAETARGERALTRTELAAPAESQLIRATSAWDPPMLPRRPRGARSHLAMVAVILTVVVSLAGGGFAAARTATAGASAGRLDALAAAAQAAAAPSGRAPSGPWTTIVGAVVYIPPPPPPPPGPVGGSAYLSSIEPCQSSYMFVPNISPWTAPPGCYSNIYVPNPANYPARPIFGWCNWWVRENHLGNYNITLGSQVYRGTTPVVGEAIFFQGGVQGASAIGHWAQLVAIAPDRYWMLVSEMNFDWRGGGFGRVDYRYVHVGPGLSFYS